MWLFCFGRLRAAEGPGATWMVSGCPRRGTERLHEPVHRRESVHHSGLADVMWLTVRSGRPVEEALPVPTRPSGAYSGEGFASPVSLDPSDSIYPCSFHSNSCRLTVASLTSRNSEPSRNSSLPCLRRLTCSSPRRSRKL